MATDKRLYVICGEWILTFWRLRENIAILARLRLTWWRTGGILTKKNFWVTHRSPNWSKFIVTQSLFHKCMSSRKSSSKYNGVKKKLFRHTSSPRDSHHNSCAFHLPFPPAFVNSKVSRRKSSMKFIPSFVVLSPKFRGKLFYSIENLLKQLL